MRSALAMLLLMAPVSASANALILDGSLGYPQLEDLSTGSLAGDWYQIWGPDNWLEYRGDVRGVYFFDVFNADTMQPVPGLGFVPQLRFAEEDMEGIATIAERCDIDGCRNAVLIVEPPDVYGSFGLRFASGPIYDTARVAVRIRQYLDASLDEFGQPSGAPDGELHLFFVPEPGVAALLALGLAALGARQRMSRHSWM